MVVVFLLSVHQEVVRCHVFFFFLFLVVALSTANNDFGVFGCRVIDSAVGLSELRLGTVVCKG